MKYRHLPLARTSLAVLLAPAFSIFAGFAFAAPPVASESFWTTDLEPLNGEYRQGHLANPDVEGTNNSVVVAGTSGFDATLPWKEDTSSIQVLADFGLEHSGLVGESQPGGIRWTAFQEGMNRNSNRTLAATPKTSSSYYLSGLIRAAGSITEEGHAATVGFLPSISPNTFDISQGFYFGLHVEEGDLKIAAFANDQSFELVNLSQERMARVYQIVLRLDVDAAGDEILTAWIVRDADASLTQVLAPTPVGNFWATPADLEIFTLQTRGAGVENREMGRFDEMRFGTTLEAVTTAVP
jgi:hypothetical protein